MNNILLRFHDMNLFSVREWHNPYATALTRVPVGAKYELYQAKMHGQHHDLHNKLVPG